MLSLYILLGTFGILGSFAVRQSGEPGELAEWRRVEWGERRKADWNRYWF